MEYKPKKAAASEVYRFYQAAGRLHWHYVLRELVPEHELIMVMGSCGIRRLFDFMDILSKNIKQKLECFFTGVDFEKESRKIREFVSRPMFDEAVLLNKDKSYPKISIITPSYNQAQFLERTILSVLNQNYPNLEYIIIDGGSTDNSLEIIKKYERYITYWVSEPDRGQSHALNKGLVRATGEWIGWQNSDDVYFPGTLKHISEKVSGKLFRETIISGIVASINEDDTIISISKFAKPSFNRLLYEGMIMSSQGVFWTIDLHKKFGNFKIELNHAMDYDFWLRVLRKGKIIFIPCILGGFRKYAGTKTTTSGHKGTMEIRLIRKEYGLVSNSMKHILIKKYYKIHRILNWILQSLKT